MTTETNDVRLSASQAPKRKWSAPRVIEEDLSNTQTPRPTQRAARDYFYYAAYGS